MLSQNYTDTPYTPAARTVNWCGHYGNQYEGSSTNKEKTKAHVIQLSRELLGIHSKEPMPTYYRYACSSMLIVALFTRAKLGSQPG